jgi:hypothetical protein
MSFGGVTPSSYPSASAKRPAALLEAADRKTES